jgi:hypothetical protein
MLYFGDGVSRDPAKGFSWFTQAAEGGHPGAQFNVGVAYQTGSHVAQDSAAAAAWFSRAAAQGHPAARVNLAVMYSSGAGVAKDFVRAYMWADLAASAGEPAGAKLRDSLKSMMTSDQIIEAQRASREWKPERC